MCPEYVPERRLGGATETTAGTPIRTPSGHVFRVDPARGSVWYAKYRLPDGCQVQKKIGPVWSERGRPQEGYFTKRLV